MCIFFLNASRPVAFIEHNFAPAFLSTREERKKGDRNQTKEARKFEMCIIPNDRLIRAELASSNGSKSVLFLGMS